MTRLLCLGLLLGSCGPPPAPLPVRAYPIPAAPDAPSRGPADAPVEIQVFSDFECPYCAELVPTLERVRRAYGDRVRIVFRHLPLPFHEHAMLAAEVAVDVFVQGGDEAFWAFHDRLFDDPSSLEVESLLEIAAATGVDVERTRRALDTGVHQPVIRADMRAYERAGVGRTGTPACFVNGRLLLGAQPYERFAALIDSLP